MKPPPKAPRKRPAQTALRPPRTRTEAAVALVRAEFERERLERDLASLAARADAAQSACELAAHRGRGLRAMLAEPGDGFDATDRGRR